MPSSERFAIAIDLGTTTIAAALISLPGGEVVARSGSLNPQRVHGLDVVSRLQYACGSAENLKELQMLVNRELARMVADLLASAGGGAGAVETVAIAGNPTMSHLLLGLAVDTLAHPPYRPRITGSHRLDTLDLGWPVSFPLYVFPSPGGFVGGDTVAFLYGLGFPDFRAPNPEPRAPNLEPRSPNLEPRSPIPDPALFLDLGTNGEITLLSGGTLYATSAAAGPAFEGGNLSCGMAALPGAISSVQESDGRLITTTVDKAPPRGLCGSGVLDIVSLLLSEGLMDATGRLLEPAEVASQLGDRLQEINGERRFVIYHDAQSIVSLSQGDIRQIQLAKGAVRAGIEVLLARAGISSDSVHETILTGSFGAALSLESLNSIGILTENMVKTSRFIREGALSGVIRSLMAPEADQQIDRLSTALRIIPLSGTPLFEQHFMAHINFTS